MKSFGMALTQLLRDRDISATALARQLGMRSKTSLLRILQDKASYASAQKFWEQLLASNPMGISDQERAHLEQCLEILRVGPEDYRTYQALQALLHAQPVYGKPIAVQGLPGIDTFDALTAHYAAAQALEITIIGLCDARIFESLHRMCCAMPAQQQPNIQHYIFRIVQAAETIRDIRAVLPMLFQRNYTAHMVSLDPPDTERYFPGEMLLCRMTDSQGQVHHHQLAFAAPSQMQAIAYPDSRAYDYWQALIGANGRGLPPLKTDFHGVCAPADYLPYIEEIRQLELNCNLYMLKPDIPLCMVPTGILYRAVLEGDLFCDSAPDAELMRQLYKSHDQRYHHLFHRRKVTHSIFSRQAMRSFAQTGRTSDHFFGARAYTPQERVAILTHCLQQSLNNPYFSIHFSRDDALIQTAEISCYEGKGTILLNARTSYRLDEDHCEALITHEGFNQQFRAYYVNELLRHHVLPSASNHAFLQQLIDIAAQAH